jgi:hypothetical protein
MYMHIKRCKASSVLWNATVIWIPDYDPMRDRNLYDWLAKNIEYLDTIECILLDCMLCDLIIDNAQYEQCKKE